MIRIWIKVSFFVALLLIFTVKAYCEEVLTWQECLAEAGKNNPELISAVEGVNQQKAAKAVTTSSLYPQVSGSLSASRTETETATTATNTKGKTITDSYSYGVSGTQLLFDGLKSVNDVKGALENIKEAQENYKFTSSGVRLSLRTAFINLLKAQELIKVAEEIARIRRDNLELITLRYHSGLEHRGALLTAGANIAGATFELAQAKRAVTLAQRQLTKEMGRSNFIPFTVKGDFSIREKIQEKPDIEALAKSNPSLLQSLAKKNAASFSLKSAYAEFFPQISAEAGLSRRSSSWPARYSSVNGGLTLTVPIFEGGLKFAQVSKAQAVYKAAEADERSMRDGIIVSLEEAWKSLQDAIDTVEVQRKTLEANDERFRIAEAQYSIGFIDFDSWIIIGDNLVTSKKAFLNAQANALFAEADWIQAKGEMLEYAQ